jgi:hypothetical protein
MTPTSDVEERLTRHARIYKETTETASDLHARIMAQTVVKQHQHRSLFRELALAGAMLIFLGLLAFGVSRMKDFGGNAPAKKTPAPQSLVIPWVAAPPTSTPHPEPSTVTTTPDKVAGVVAQKVTGASPALVPSVVPAGMNARVSAEADFFDIQYTSARGDRLVTLSIVVANPPPPGTHGTQSMPRFHGDRRALYQVDDGRLPTSHRLLMWTEPGIWSADALAEPGVPYLLSATGLTEGEFWQIANSLKPAFAATACVTDDLKPVAGGVNTQAGTAFATVYVFNGGPAPCILAQPANVDLVLSSGGFRSVPVSIERSASLLLAPAAKVTMGQYFLVVAGTPCGRPGESAIRGFRVLGRLITEPTGLCLSGSSTPSAESGRLSVLGPTMKLGPSALSAALRAPARAVAGRQLKYEVTLTNISGRPVLFGECPAYVEQLGPGGPRAHYRLNCQPAGIIAPGASATFAMVFDLPSDLPAGNRLVTLTWTLDPPYSDVNVATLLAITQS